MRLDTTLFSTYKIVAQFYHFYTDCILTDIGNYRLEVGHIVGVKVS